ncbi:hypothetical protein AB6A40_009088 [Gnathostoma spinigerum]|uniref:Uncharacterized protein n=1 Tax=Gnathostoma spinigerum TaxID=75299 RepID=A0ABD6EQX5_9BILA
MATTQHPTFMSTEMSSEVISPMSLTYAEVTALDIDYSQPADNGDAHRSPYESFCFYARSPTADTRDMAVRSIARTLSTLDSVTNRFEIETVFDILKNSLAKDENFQARCSLIEQIPLLYIEFHQIDYLMYEADALLSHILASSLDNTLELVC